MAVVFQPVDDGGSAHMAGNLAFRAVSQRTAAAISITGVDGVDAGEKKGKRKRPKKEERKLHGGAGR